MDWKSTPSSRAVTIVQFSTTSGYGEVRSRLYKRAIRTLGTRPDQTAKMPGRPTNQQPRCDQHRIGRLPHRGRGRRSPERFRRQSQQPAVGAPAGSRTTRTVATWTTQTGNQPPRAYSSARPWGQQLQVAADTRADRVPYPFRGYTVSETNSAAPEADAQPDVDAVYCEVCGGLVVQEPRHVLSLNHCAQRVPGVEAVLARVRRDPEFAARLGAALPAAIGAAAPQVSGDLMDLTEDDEKDL
ncbi:hypothetical protein HPB47_006709 [Ixodes persulcatus]|uniref:Uncharacterized protein n=1 Tax=Ixodes persulcatus TaxID=34615 RepID=A0AC60P9B5_IXOPE|nr:hypothetical protein HPB47_006709 [Ixodes persulcatus]